MLCTAETVLQDKSLHSPTDLEKIIHAIVSSRLDYCNVLYFGLSRRNLQRLQLIQNAAALHWLPVSFRIDFKIVLLVF